MSTSMRTLILIFGVLLSLQAQAQITFGVRGGTTFNTISQTEVLDAVTPDLDYLVGFSGAIYTNIPVADNISFQPELAYSQKGFALSQGADIDLFGAPLPLGVVANSHFNYLDIPLLFKASFGQDALQGFVMAGPAVGYALSGRLKTKANGLLDLNLTNTEINLDAINYERFEFSGVVGAGMSYQTGFGAVSLDGRFQQGFTELYDIPLVAEKVKNKGFAINLGLNFNIN